jgi:hypothetical protein
LKDERRHQSARQIEIDGAASGGLLDMKRSPTRVHGGHMRDDHLGCEHGFQLVPRADPMEKRQDEVCGRGVEGFRGISVKGIYELLEESLGDDLLRRPECGKVPGTEIFQIHGFVDDRLDSLPCCRSADRDAWCGHRAQRHPDGGFGHALQIAQDGLLRTIGDLGSADGWRALDNITGLMHSAPGMGCCGDCECQRCGR